MSLKINYINNQKKSHKNSAIFLTNHSKISDLKGIFDEKTNQKILNFLKSIQKSGENKISSFDLDFDKKIIFISISKKKQFFRFRKNWS